MTTLVTGATGFIGSVLSRQLLERGHTVRILRRSKSQLDLLGTAADDVEHALGDVRCLSSLTAAMKGVSVVYHCAATVAVVAANRGLIRHMAKVNVQGTANVVDAAIATGVDRLVHTSSIAALGRPEAGNVGVIDESMKWRASKRNSHYARSKHEAELQAHRGIAEGLDVVMVNPSVVFGTGRPGELTMEVFELAQKGYLRWAPKGGVNVVDVEDVAAGHILAMERGQTGERYILGGENLSWRAIIEALAVATGKQGPRWALPNAPVMAAATLLEFVAWLTRTNPYLDRTTARMSSEFWRMSSDKAAQELGYASRPFVETARRMAAESHSGS